MVRRVASISFVLSTLCAVIACGPRPAAAPGAGPVAAAKPAPVPAQAGAVTPVAGVRPVSPGLFPTPLVDEYREVADRIIAAALSDQGAWKKLSYLTDKIGPRLSGSANLERAVAWALSALQADGHVNVAAEKVMVPHWVRGEESGAVLGPVERDLFVLGLGGTVATTRAGVTGDVVVVRDFAELERLGEAAVKGKIVLFNAAMPAYDRDEGAGYGQTVRYRSTGPVAAARLGAIAVMVRSVTAHSLRSPHTGATRYDDAVRRIPAVAVSTEDADLMARLAAAGERVRVRLRTSGRVLPDAESANVVAELRGRERPGEIVVIGAHLDSWDVGQGAHDDGTGVVIMMQALTVLRNLGLQPRRTIRVVLFTNEENGLRGALAYARDHDDEIGLHVAALESDSGGFDPRGFQVEVQDAAERDAVVARVRDIASLLGPIDATEVKAGFGGADIMPLARAGVPALGLWVEGETYFDYHHTHADTLDKVDETDLRENVAAVAVLAYVLADMPTALADD